MNASKSLQFHDFYPELSFSSGKRAFIAGVADDNGYGWAIAKALAAAGAEILVGTWVPVCSLYYFVILAIKESRLFSLYLMEGFCCVGIKDIRN